MVQELSKEDIHLLEDRVNEQLGKLQMTNQILRENVFLLLQKETHFLQYPIEDDELCAFVCKKRDKIFSYINSYIPQDKQIFAAAHELYHIWYEQERLDQVEILNNSTLENEPTIKSEKMANRFAAMLLVPKTVLLQHMRLLNIATEKIQLKDIVQLLPIFQVPYKTMVLRLREIRAINENECEEFLAIPDRDETKGVLFQMKVLQLPLSLQSRSKNIVLDGFTGNILKAYDQGEFSYNELREFLALVNQTPGDFGYPEMTDDDLKMLLEDCEDDN
ncbi:ImmA/IrrE family metallo-endopeptidase [uncultured Planococcus sp.]|uniref:ImmA/IrrE family metallo-endopeptidase n=1 Tax=uncultured Planococcus sp. TaxID=337815 RepID=UPI002623CCAF|nr:ImmA/IrrE family metallo-endopeptidase [uncultured Planococcus sp.]